MHVGTYTTRMARPAKFIPPSQARLQRLVSHGYFPNELPPPFSTVDYGNSAADFAAKWDGKKIRKFWTAPESYSIPRFGHARRKLSIVNPINQLHVAYLISANWQAIRTRLNRSTITEFKPGFVLKGPGRAVTGVDFDKVARRRAEILGTYGRYIKTDIARFYPSVYTHAIPWAILGRAHCKANHNTQQFKDSFANLLDKAVAAGQEGQTIGIPIGPDTSRILSEAIAVEVEEIARSHISHLNDRGVRYVDDMLLGFDETETPSGILSGVSNALYEFELELNADKTVTLGIGCTHTPEWRHYIRTFRMNSKASMQRDDLDSFFEQAICLADANPRDNVLLFAVKRAAGFSIDDSNMAHLVRWMLYVSRRSPSCISFVAEHLAALGTTAPLPNADIEGYILQQIPLKAETIHTDELAWLLFWAREIGLKIPAFKLTNVTKLRSSVVALLTLDIQQHGLVEGSLDQSFWEYFATADGLKSEMWMVAYEATKKGWWSSNLPSNFVSRHAFFGDLWEEGIEFYDTKKKARKKVKPAFLAQSFAAYAEVGPYEY